MNISPLKNRKTILFLAILASLLIGGFCLWWGLLAYELRVNLDNWLVQRRAEGWVITTGSPSFGGFPLQASLILPSPSLLAADGSGWKGPEMRLSLSSFAPTHLQLIAHGKHVLTPPGQPPQEAFIAELRAEVNGDEAKIDLQAVEALGLRLTKGSLRLQGQVMQADLSGLTLPEDSRLVLGNHIEHLAFTAQAKGALMPTLAAWRDGGGILELSHLQMDWQPLHVSGEGTLALDKRMQPLYAGTATIGGMFETMDKMTAAGAVRAQDAAMARMVLKALALPGPDGKPQLSVPLTVQENRLYLGPVKLMTMPDLVWPNLFYFRNN